MEVAKSLNNLEGEGHHSDNNQLKVVTNDKTGQEYTVKGSIY